MAKTPAKAPAKAPPAKVPAAPKKSTAVAVRGSTELANPGFAERILKDKGRGFSMAQEDGIVPIIRVLQDLSPQVKRSKPEYIDGAEPGDFELRGLPEPYNLVKGSVGFIFQPCGFSKDVIEWRPRDAGGGFVRRHEQMPKDADEETDEKTGRLIYTRNGNDLVDTRYHAGFVIIPDFGDFPFILPFKSTGHQTSRDWTQRMKVRMVNGVIAPAWLYTYHITTKEKTNTVGQSWAAVNIENYGEIETDEEYDRGEAMNQAFQIDKVIEAEIDQDEGAGGAGNQQSSGNRRRNDNGAM